MNNNGRIETPAEAIPNIKILPFLRESGGTIETKRIGAPPLRPLPLCNVQLEPGDPNLAWFNDIQYKIEALLQNNGILSHSVQLCGRKINAFNSSLFVRLPPSAISETEHIDITILVIAPWSEYAHLIWPKCVNELRELVVFEGCPYIKVEMLDNTLTKARYISEVQASDPFVSAWNCYLRDYITNAIDHCPGLKHMWRSIDVMHLGPHEVQHFDSASLLGYGSGTSRNPIVISVTVDKSLPEHVWRPAESHIREILDYEGYLEIEIEFERGVVEHFRASLDDIQTDNYLNHQLPLVPTTDNSLRPGMSFSGSTPNIDENGQSLPSSIGTTGPILQLLDKFTAEPISNFLLTSYHAVRPWISGWRKENLRESMPARSGSECDS